MSIEKVADAITKASYLIAYDALSGTSAPDPKARGNRLAKAAIKALIDEAGKQFEKTHDSDWYRTQFKLKQLIGDV